jgi:hypothetical protein
MKFSINDLSAIFGVVKGGAGGAGPAQRVRIMPAHLAALKRAKFYY